jgi:hypothetical protein
MAREGVESSSSGSAAKQRRTFRGGFAIVTAVFTVAVVLLVGGGVLHIPRGWFGETVRTRRIVSPDGRTDLVLTWRGGGGAAGWTEESVALEPHGPPRGDGDELATFDPEALVGARWLSNGVAEIGLSEPIDALPATVRVGGRTIELRTRDLRHLPSGHLRED